MSNVGRDALLKFGKITLSSYSIVKYHKLYSIQLPQTDQLACSSLVSRCNEDARLCNLCCSQVIRVQKRPLSEKAEDAQGGAQDVKQSDESEKYSSFSSSHYRQYHRQSYERRRNHYANNDHGQSKSTKFEANDPRIMGNHYQRLNIPLDADLDTIKSAYYSLSKIYHPDIVGSDDKDGAENFRLITESYDTLSDTQLKADYDSQLKGDPKDIVDAKDFGRHPGRPNNDFDVIYRMRETEMFFRAKQEAALRREKILNPKKFRAGSFIKSDDDPREQLARLQKRMDRLHSSRSSQRVDPHDGSDFYREHLLNSMHRQRDDLQLHATFHKFRYNNAGNTDTLSLLVALSALPFFVTAVLLFAYCDFAGDLDDLLGPKDSSSQKGQS